jgi:hypothetical protein
MNSDGAVSPNSNFGFLEFGDTALLCLGPVMPRPCYASALLCLGPVMPRPCYASALLCLLCGGSWPYAGSILTPRLLQKSITFSRYSRVIAGKRES